jgi:hypothetical protein
MSGRDLAPLETRQERLWREFLDARERAWVSQDYRDGIAVGQAFSAFLREFLGPDLRPLYDRGAGR